MLRAIPSVVRNRETNREEPGLIEAFVAMMPNGRCERTPQVWPLYLLATPTDRETVLRWLKQNRPDLLPRSRRPG
jgi:hypothetical protein